MNKKNDFYFWFSIFLLFSMGMLVFIMYREEFNWNKENVEAVTVVLGMIGTVAAAIVAAYAANISKKTLERQEKEFRRSLEPLLALKVNEFEFTIDFDNPSFFSKDWAKDVAGLGEFLQEINIPLINLSNGVARDIEVVTQVTNHEEIVGKFNEYNRKPEFEMEYENDEDAIVIHNVSIIDGQSLGGSASYRYRNFEPQKFVYISKETNETNIKIKIPSLYMALSNIYLYSCFYLEEVEFPTVLIRVKCKDIAGLTYNFNYSLTLGIRHFDIHSFANQRVRSGQAKVYFDIKSLA